METSDITDTITVNYNDIKAKIFICVLDNTELRGSVFKFHIEFLKSERCEGYKINVSNNTSLMFNFTTTLTYDGTHGVPNVLESDSESGPFEPVPFNITDNELLTFTTDHSSYYHIHYYPKPPRGGDEKVKTDGDESKPIYIDFNFLYSVTVVS